MDHSTLKAMTMALVAAVSLCADDAVGAPTEEQRCQAGLVAASGKYVLCQSKARAKLDTAVGGDSDMGDHTSFDRATSKCRVKYDAVAFKLQAKYPTATCSDPRYVSNGTVLVDTLTLLQWELKTGTVGGPINLADPHDVNNLYKLNIDMPVSSAANGTAYTSFLAALNTAPCYAGHCDWRLPTLNELKTLFPEPYTGNPCTIQPCIDPVFGATFPGFHGTSSSWSFNANFSWFVSFSNQTTITVSKGVFIPLRAVRTL